MTRVQQMSSGIVVKWEICKIDMQETNLQQLSDAIKSIWTKISKMFPVCSCIYALKI